MATGILHLHVTVVILFLILLLLKTILLLANSHGTLKKLRDKTKVLDMVFGTLILITGAYLIYATRFETYLLVKIVITLIGIPLGIIAFKKESKVVAVLALFAFVYVYGVAETDSWKFKQDPIVLGDQNQVVDANNEVMLKHARAIYLQECAICHGEDGKLGKSGAKDLSQSELTQEEAEDVIENGRNLMPAYGKRLSDGEIKALAKFVLAL